jgi:hypothetical protein
MTSKKKNARPKALKPSVRSLIAKRAIENPTYDRTFLANDLIKEIENAGDIAPTIETLKVYISSARSKYTEDKPWNTATLSSEPVNPEVVLWLIMLQQDRKSQYSKPLTIREGKWINRLSGFKIASGFDLSSVGIDEKSMGIFIWRFIATFAQIYAYREQIDTIAGIKEPDYSDLDNQIITGDIKSIFLYSLDWYIKGISNLVPKESTNKDKTKTDYKRIDKIFVKPSIIEKIRFAEIHYLGHSLGEPDISENSMITYHNTLITLIIKDSWDKVFKALPYSSKIRFLTSLRKYFKDNPDHKHFNDSMKEKKNFYSIISTLLNEAKKDGEPK